MIIIMLLPLIKQLLSETMRMEINKLLMNLVNLVIFQGELIVGDQSGAIHMWDLKTDHNEQLVSEFTASLNTES